MTEPTDPPHVQVISPRWLPHLIIGAILAVLGIILGAVFWLGAAYNRFTGIEKETAATHQEIVKVVDRLDALTSAFDKQADLTRRVERLEDAQDKLR